MTEHASKCLLVAILKIVSYHVLSFRYWQLTNLATCSWSVAVNLKWDLLIEVSYLFTIHVFIFTICVVNEFLWFKKQVFLLHFHLEELLTSSLIPLLESSHSPFLFLFSNCLFISICGFCEGLQINLAKYYKPIHEQLAVGGRHLSLLVLILIIFWYWWLCLSCLLMYPWYKDSILELDLAAVYSVPWKTWHQTLLKFDLVNSKKIITSTIHIQRVFPSL